MSDVELEMPSDDELFNEAVETTDDPGVTEQVEQVEQHQPEPNEPPTLEADRQQADDNAPQVPSWRVREINEEKRALADRVAALEAERLQWQRQQPTQQPQKAPEKPARPDPLIDPEGYAAAIREEVRQEAIAERREESLIRARESNPTEFDEAYAAAQQAVDPALKARMQASRDPGKTLLEWHRENKVKAEVGNDPNAWLEKKLEERLKDPAFLAKAVELARGSAQPQQTNGRPRVELPPTLSSASRAQATSRANSDEGKSDFELFQEIAG